MSFKFAYNCIFSFGTKYNLSCKNQRLIKLAQTRILSPQYIKVIITKHLQLDICQLTQSLLFTFYNLSPKAQVHSLSLHPIRAYRNNQPAQAKLTPSISNIRCIQDNRKRKKKVFNLHTMLSVKATSSPCFLSKEPRQSSIYLE